VKGVLRALIADFSWLLSGYRGIALIVLLPVVLLVLVGQLRTRAETFAFGVAGRPTAGTLGAERLDRAIQVWEQLSALEVRRLARPQMDPLRALRQADLDLLLNVGDADTTCWRIYTAETDPARAAVLQQIAASIERSVLLIATAQQQALQAFCPPAVDEPEATKAAADVKPEAEKTGGEAGRVAVELSTSLVGFSVFPPVTFSAYYPRALNRRLALLPMTIALVISFVPFVLAVSSLIREKEAHTLEILLSAPEIDGRALFVAKTLLPVALTLFNVLTMVVLVDVLFGLHAKGAAGRTLLMLVPAVTSASLLGVAASTFVTSQTQAVMTSALYFFALTLLTGFITPLAEASLIVRVMSRLLPLSYALPLLNNWFFGADLAATASLAWSLAAQLVLYGCIAAYAFWHFLGRL
jgi:hypothetical protein